MFSFRAHLWYPARKRAFEMPETLRPQGVIHFGPFEADLRTQELRKHGIRLRLAGQSFQILCILLERNGELVTRDELRLALWPENTYLDFDHGVNAAVNRLREALGDAADDPHLIETLPRRGYRFIGVIEPVTTSSPTSPDPRRILPASPPSIDRPAPPGTWFRQLRTWIWLVPFGAIFLLGAFISLRLPSHGSPRPPNPVPFTAFPGIEIYPTFSPNGSQIAFAWNGDPKTGAEGFDLFVKMVGSEEILRLTHHPSTWLSPAWSPDGTQVAFLRRNAGDSGLYLVPALGGPERKLVPTNMPYDAFSSISWSADGTTIAFPDVDVSSGNTRLNLVSTKTLELTRIPHQSNCGNEGFAAFSPRGNRLAYVCTHGSGMYALYVGDGGGKGKLVTTFTGWPNGIAWESNMEKIVLAQDRGTGGELAEVTVADGSIQNIAFGQGADWPAISAKGDKLAYSQISQNVNIWRKSLSRPDAPAVKLISSTREQNNPQYSPDQKHIAFESIRNGDREVWMSDADGTNLVQVSHFRYPLTGTPHWSPDSRKIVFDSHNSGVYIADIADLLPRKLLTDVPDPSEPSWSKDGESIFFVSGPADGQKLYRCPVTGGHATVLSASRAFSPLPTFDGKAVIFANDLNSPTLKLVSLQHPTEESDLHAMPIVKDADLWTLEANGIYFVPADSPRSIDYFDFATRHVRHVTRVEKDFRSWIGGLSVSSDGLLYSQMDEANGDLMLVENFR
jgi:Tol biopolymer transport system component/DNA-binding winged helix-turn-helix (wHTH) protein